MNSNEKDAAHFSENAEFAAEIALMSVQYQIYTFRET